LVGFHHLWNCRSRRERLAEESTKRYTFVQILSKSASQIIKEYYPHNMEMKLTVRKNSVAILFWRQWRREKVLWKFLNEDEMKWNEIRKIDGTRNIKKYPTVGVKI